MAGKAFGLLFKQEEESSEKEKWDVRPEKGGLNSFIDKMPIS